MPILHSTLEKYGPPVIQVRDPKNKLHLVLFIMHFMRMKISFSMGSYLTTRILYSCTSAVVLHQTLSINVILFRIIQLAALKCM
jgi:hypothetical protein